MQTSFEYASTREFEDTEQREACVQIQSSPEESLAFEIWGDQVFGTLAFRQVPTTATPVVSGKAVDTRGQPLARREVTLTAGDKVFSTMTNAQGRYSFSTATIPAGSGTVEVPGAARRPVVIRQR